MTAEPVALPSEAAARLLGIARPTLRRLLRRGELPAHGPAGAMQVPYAALIAYRDRQAGLRRGALAELAQLSESHDL
ncbi:helix-turn-helix domain-containing protein [Dankookia sp. GCM10030260]|uniref:helix-turn-helix domain-containing protein n=1 Tax=Dankookia sp. GCM10030260 TaxID=3273390 RepID=UPI00361E7853